MNQTKDTPQGRLYVVSAPSGAGKTSLLAALVEQLDHLIISVSYTTRQKRPGELEGVHYNFVSQAEFDALVEKKAFLEYARVFNHCYGTSLEWVQSHLEKGLDILLEIDWQGARQIRTLFENYTSIFILPPSKMELEARLYARKQDSQDIIQQRMSEAHEEMTHYSEYDYLVINQHFDKALAEMKAIIVANRLRQPYQVAQHAALLKDLTL